MYINIPFVHPLPSNPIQSLLSIFIPKIPPQFVTRQISSDSSGRHDSTPSNSNSATFVSEKKMQTQASYIEALETELAKMMMFKTELPLSIQLVSQTIESCRSRLLLTLKSGDDVDQVHACNSLSEETSSDDSDVDVSPSGHVLEFIPLKKSRSDGSSSSQSEDIRGCDDVKDNDNALGKKSDWLSSAQLWNMSPDLPANSEDMATQDELENLEDKCECLDDEKLDEEEKSSPLKQTESSSAESRKSSDGGCKKEEKEGSSKRKQRRCWSQDLHRKFLNSLKQLGGAHVATPKQIRELMKIDGLTNDEVKSHLQKYRLHTRRPASRPSQINVQAPPQFVVVGSIWPQHNSDGNRALGTSRTSVYTPMAQPPHETPLDQKCQYKSLNNEGHGDALARCISSSMSSSTRTTASQVY